MEFIYSIFNERRLQGYLQIIQVLSFQVVSSSNQFKSQSFHPKLAVRNTLSYYYYIIYSPLSICLLRLPIIFIPWKRLDLTVNFFRKYDHSATSPEILIQYILDGTECLYFKTSQVICGCYCTKHHEPLDKRYFSLFIFQIEWVKNSKTGKKKKWFVNKVNS